MRFLFKFYVNFIYKRNLKCYFLARLNMLLRDIFLFLNWISKYYYDDIRRECMALYDIFIRIFWNNSLSSLDFITKYFVLITFSPHLIAIKISNTKYLIPLGLINHSIIRRYEVVKKFNILRFYHWHCNFCHVLDKYIGRPSRKGQKHLCS